MMTAHNTPLLKRSAWASLMLASLSLAACTGPDLQVSRSSDVQQRAEVELVRLAHTVSPEEDYTDTPSLSTLDDIHAFFGDVSVGYGDVVFLDANAAVAPERLVAIEKFVRARGISYGGLQVLGSEPDAGTIVIYVERHVVTPPNCGEWRDEATRDRRNSPSFHHGCATAASLAMMVANPRDLIDGVNGASNTAAAITALKRLYHTRNEGITLKPTGVDVSLANLPSGSQN